MMMMMTTTKLMEMVLVITPDDSCRQFQQQHQHQSTNGYDAWEATKEGGGKELIRCLVWFIWMEMVGEVDLLIC